MITKQEYFSRHKKPIASNQIEVLHIVNAEFLISKVNQLWAVYEKQNGNRPLIVSSGYRTKAINASIKGSAKRSNHMMGLAVDIQDPQKILQRWLKTPAGLKALEDADLYCEDFSFTKTWVHFQTTRPLSGMRFFMPFKKK
jgi:hypothetical protein